MEAVGTNKKYTVKDLYAEAARLVRAEMTGLKSKAATPAEEAKISALAKTISQTVLKEMRLV
ncbi:MAG: hypothetical protein MUC35_01420 [Candidatus Margulisbacteria bacterium]|jgi:hypothetical protein|nr:hypothetical protein [Candidatus Margulisiibacteriota bacterium]